MQAEASLRAAVRTERAVSAGVEAAVADSALERKCSLPLGWFCYLMFSSSSLSDNYLINFWLRNGG